MANFITKALIGINKFIDPEFNQFWQEQVNVNNINKSASVPINSAWDTSPPLPIDLGEYGISIPGLSDSNKNKMVEQRHSILTYDQMWEFYRYNSLIRACIDTKAKQVSSLDWEILPVNVHYLKSNKLPPKKMAEKKYLTDMLFKPNTYDETFQGLLSKVLVDLLLFDAGALLKIYDPETNKPIGLKSLHGPALRFIINKQREIVGYLDIQTEEVYTEKEVIYLKFHGTSKGHYGQPPIESIIPEITGDMYSIIYSNKYFSENEVPHGLLYLGDIDQVNYNRVKDSFKAYRARHYAIRMIASKSEPKWINFKQTNRDMQFMELNDKLRKRIMTVFQINDNELGYTSDVNKGAGEVQSAIFANKGLRPLVKFIEGHLNSEFIQEINPDFIFQFDKKEELKSFETLRQVMVQTDLMKIQLFNLAYSDGKISLKEYRTLLGKLITINEDLELKELDWSDVNIIPGGGYNSLQNALALTQFELENTMRSRPTVTDNMGGTSPNQISVADFKNYLDGILNPKEANKKQELPEDIKAIMNSLNVPKTNKVTEFNSNKNTTNLPNVPALNLGDILEGNNKNTLPTTPKKTKSKSKGTKTINTPKVANPDTPLVIKPKLPNPVADKTSPVAIKKIKVQRKKDNN